jgi:nicotinamide phosphoribosyltransferase
MNINPLTCIDGYKADHRRQYPEGTTLVYSNFTPRSNKHASTLKGLDERVVFFGLQYFIKWFLIDQFNRGFFRQDKAKVVAQYKRRMDAYLGKDAFPLDHIEALHDLGYLPIRINALPEGALVDPKVPVFTIENTIPEFFWLTNYLETVLSAMCWKACTSATTAFKYRQLLMRYAKLTGGDQGFTVFQAHDFSFRGMGGIQDAAISGAAHLTSFAGTDTIPAIDLVEDYYNANVDEGLVGCSVPATEHSVMCMNGPDGEFDTFRRLITELYPSGIVSIVSDSFDFWQVVTDFLPRLKDGILARKGGPVGDKVVIRPDSGDPVKIICGDPDAKTDREYKGAVECLWDTFGGTLTEKGYRVLNPHIGLIYGDSITLERASEIMRRLEAKGLASTNVVLGVGSYTYNYTTRDVHGFAMKATAGEVNGKTIQIFKDPKTDSGMKKSAKGFLAVGVGQDGKYTLTDGLASPVDSHLVTVFQNGYLLVDHKLFDIRNRIAKELK